MRLIRTELFNVCQHRLLAHNWHPGLNGIVGPNGAGKSNLLKMIEAAVTGNFGVNAGKKDDNISQFADDTAKSHIIVHAEHNGTRLELIRGLRGTKSQLSVDGGAPELGDKKVNEALAEIINLSPKVLSEYIFVKQGGLFDFIEQLPSERSRIFQHLFGTLRVEECWRLLGDTIAGIPAEMSFDEIDTAARLISEKRAELKELKAQRKPLEHLRDYCEDKSDEARIVKEYEELLNLKRDERQILAALQTAEGKLKPAKRAAKDAAAAYTTAQAGLADVQADYDVAKAALSNWKAYKLQQKQRRELAARRKQLEARVQLEPTPPEWLDDGAKLCVDRDNLRHQVNMRRETLKTLDAATGLAECPTCHTPVKSLAGMLKKFAAELPELEQQLAEHIAKIKAIDAYDEAYGRWQVWADGHDKALKALAADEALLGDEPEAPGSDEAELNELVSAVHVLRQEVEQLRTTAEARKRDVAVHTTSVEQLTSRAQAISQRIHELLVDEAMYTTAKATLAKRREETFALGKLDGQIQAVESGIKAQQAVLSELERKRSYHQRQLAWKARLEEMRDVFHRDNLSHQVARAYLQQIEGDVSRLLETFGSDFIVTADDELSFQAQFPDGRVQPAARLSGGQKVVLGLSFRVAVNSLFARGIGLLFLDEPTNFLDDERRRRLTTALQALRELSASRGLQCLLVTHDRQLCGLFDDTLDLTP